MNKLAVIKHETEMKHVDEKYNDIMNLPHHEPKTRQRMPIINRAASFSPFAALTGYDDKIKETGRLTSEKIELNEETKEVINTKIQMVLDFIDTSPEVNITYFLPDDKKSGGAYVNHIGFIKRVDEYERKVIFEDKFFIPIDDILEIECEIFKDLFD